MIRSVQGIERLSNLICISYAAVRMLPYYSKEFQKYQGQSPHDFYIPPQREQTQRQHVPGVIPADFFFCLFFRFNSYLFWCLRDSSVFLSIDDTLVEKYGTKFQARSNLFDHAAHNGSNYLKGHCFVSLMLHVPLKSADGITYLSVPLGYRLWTKELSKLELAADSGKWGYSLKQAWRLQLSI